MHSNLRICTFKFLTAVIFLLNVSYLDANAAVLTEQKFNSHLRWNFFVDKDQMLITKTGNGFLIETLNLGIYEKLKSALKNIDLRKNYFQGLNYKTDGFPQSPAQIRVTLNGSNVELFSFYRSKEKKYVLDFWKNESDEELSFQELEKKAPAAKTVAKTGTKKNTPKLSVKPAIKKLPKIKSVKKQNAIFDKSFTKLAATKINPTKGYRDFRYGASYIWDYDVISPVLKTRVDLRNKTPEYIYPVKDRDLKAKNSEKEAHMQLTINLYRKGKFGLMAKSIRLYTKKYGVDKNHDYNEYLKGLALLKENLYKKDSSPIKSAIVLLDNVTKKSKNYDLKKAIFYYNIQYLLAEKSYIEVLETAKRLYVESKTEFDRESTAYASEVIFHCLGQLKQLGKMKKFSEEKTVQNLVPKQVYYAYEFFILLSEGKNKELIAEFEKISDSLQSPVAGSILYNAAEAYFRESQYEKAVKLYDEFITNYSYMTQSGFARTRLALSYEILEREIPKTKNLYIEAINKSTNPKARYEAKVRFVALTNARKYKPTEQDKEYMVFLEYEEDEKKQIDNNIKTLLWLTRLRSFINKEEYKEALSYISTLPVKTFTPVLRRMFQGDGAEIVYGMILENFNSGNFPRVVKLWEIYRDLYEDNVAGEPYLNFIVAQSYINLGLEDSLKRTLANLERIRTAPAREFPNWVERVDYGSINTLVAELKILSQIKERKWEQVVTNIQNTNISAEKKMFYLSRALYATKEFEKNILISEKFLRETPKRLPLNRKEVKEFFIGYMSSLFQERKFTQFMKVSEAVLTDIFSAGAQESFADLIETTTYYRIEAIASLKNSKESIEVAAKDFLTNFKNSPYSGRVKFLLAKKLTEDKRTDESIKYYEELIADDTVADYLKEMSRTEISSLKLNEKIIN